MQVHREHNQVRSARTQCSSSAGSGKSIHSRAKSRSISASGFCRLGTWSSLGGTTTVRHMRLGVLDVGSNTVHLLVVDAHRGAQPTPQLSHKRAQRRAEHVDKRGDLAKAGADALIAATIDARKQAKELGCDELLAFATSAVRDARNSGEVLKRVGKEADVDLTVLSGEDEARLTFLAVRRWLGWSAGNLICLDIGGGSLELGAGTDEDPAFAVSLPLGAARLTRDWFHSDPPGKSSVAALREHVDAALDEPVKMLLSDG